MSALTGLRLLDLSRQLPGPFCSTVLGDLVARARRMSKDVGRRPATVAEARERLGLT